MKSKKIKYEFKTDKYYWVYSKKYITISNDIKDRLIQRETKWRWIS